MVIDAATGPAAEQEPATAFFTTAARNLHELGERAGVRRMVVVSIIGTDRSACRRGLRRRDDELVIAVAEDDVITVKSGVTTAQFTDGMPHRQRRRLRLNRLRPPSYVRRAKAAPKLLCADDPAVAEGGEFPELGDRIVSPAVRLWSSSCGRLARKGVRLPTCVAGRRSVESGQHARGLKHPDEGRNGQPLGFRRHPPPPRSGVPAR
jgi:hypothetical protein